MLVDVAQVLIALCLIWIAIAVFIPNALRPSPHRFKGDTALILFIALILIFVGGIAIAEVLFD